MPRFHRRHSGLNVVKGVARFPSALQGGPAWQVVDADFVSLDSGSGLVHLAPAFGEDDFRVCKEKGLGFLQLLEPDGTFPAEVTESPTVTDVKTSIFPVIEVGLTGDLPYRQLREIARRLERKLENLSGVSGVDKYGYRAREIQVGRRRTR